jgi:hypothetical protein
MRTSLSVLMINFGFSFLFTSPALTRPAAIDDIAGATICWETGLIETYGAAGHPAKFTNNRSGAGAWEITEKGFIVRMPKSDEDFVQNIEVNGDGTLTASGQSLGTDDRKGNGHYCQPGATAVSRPATSADYENKKICWDVGHVETYGPAGHPGKAVNDHWGEFTWEVIDNKGAFRFAWPNAGVDKEFVNHLYVNDDGTLTASGPGPGFDNWFGFGHYCRPGEGDTVSK